MTLSYFQSTPLHSLDGHLLVNNKALKESRRASTILISYKLDFEVAYQLNEVDKYFSSRRQI